MKIVVAGGGYAGLACLMELRRRMDDAELVLIDPGENHLKVTHLHETVRRPLGDFQTPYAKLGDRFGFGHCRGAIAPGDLSDAAGESGIVVGENIESFDYLVIATGAAPPKLPKSGHVYDRDDLCSVESADIVRDFIDDQTRPRRVNVIGAGPSGIQVLFELSALFRSKRQQVQLCLIDREPALLSEYPAALGDYVLEKLADAGVEYLPNTEYLGCADETLELRNVVNGEHQEVSSGLSFLFPGVSPSPLAVRADRYGRIDGHANIFGAGDCARFDSRGDDALTAQVAVRQGKLVAQNIDRFSRNVRPMEYFFRELGYVISLGPLDAVGWLLFREKVVNSLPAFAIKEAVEAQYDLFVAGLDTYVL